MGNHIISLSILEKEGVMDTPGKERALLRSCGIWDSIRGILSDGLYQLLNTLGRMPECKRLMEDVFKEIMDANQQPLS